MAVPEAGRRRRRFEPCHVRRTQPLPKPHAQSERLESVSFMTDLRDLWPPPAHPADLAVRRLSQAPPPPRLPSRPFLWPLAAIRVARHLPGSDSLDWLPLPAGIVARFLWSSLRSAWPLAFRRHCAAAGCRLRCCCVRRLDSVTARPRRRRGLHGCSCQWTVSTVTLVGRGSWAARVQTRPRLRWLRRGSPTAPSSRTCARAVRAVAERRRHRCPHHPRRAGFSLSRTWRRLAAAHEACICGAHPRRDRWSSRDDDTGGDVFSTSGGQYRPEPPSRWRARWRAWPVRRRRLGGHRDHEMVR